MLLVARAHPMDSERPPPLVQVYSVFQWVVQVHCVFACVIRELFVHASIVEPFVTIASDKSKRTKKGEPNRRDEADKVEAMDVSEDSAYDVLPWMWLPSVGT